MEQPTLASTALNDTAEAPYHRVLVAVGDGGADAAIDLAGVLAAPDAAFMLVHVAPPGRADEREEADAVALERLRAARSRLGRPCEIVVETGRTEASGLHHLAAQEAADLLVLGAPDPESDGVPRAMLHGAPCDVAIPSPSAPWPSGLRHVTVAVKPSDAGRRAVLIAHDIAQVAGAALHAVSAVPSAPSVWLGPVGGAAVMLAQLDGVFDDDARRTLAQLPDATAQVKRGDPVDVLTAGSEATDLLVLGTRRRGPLRRLVVGDTVHDVCRRSASAVLLVALDEAGA